MEASPRPELVTTPSIFLDLVPLMMSPTTFLPILLGIFITVLTLLGSFKRWLDLLAPSLTETPLETDFIAEKLHSLISAALSPARQHRVRLLTVSMTRWAGDLAPDLEWCRNPARASRETLPVTLQELQLDMFSCLLELELELDITVTSDQRQSHHLICKGIFELPRPQLNWVNQAWGESLEVYKSSKYFMLELRAPRGEMMRRMAI